METDTKKIQFENQEGIGLSAQIELPPENQLRIFAIFAHCFTCSKDYKATYRISRVLSEHGIGVLRFDFTGLGESGGNFSETNFTTNVSDIKAAADFLEAEYMAPCFLAGHSLGGAASLMAARSIPSIQAVATIASPSDTQHLAGLLRSRLSTIDEKGEGEVSIAGRSFYLKKQFFDDLEKTRMESTISKLNLPLIVFHSPVDRTVSIDHANQILKFAQQPKSFISLGNADHLVSDKRDAEMVGHMMAAWAHRHVRIG